MGETQPASRARSLAIQNLLELGNFKMHACIYCHMYNMYMNMDVGAMRVQSIIVLRILAARTARVSQRRVLSVFCVCNTKKKGRASGRRLRLRPEN